MKCTCDHPMIKCDNRGCRCTICGGMGVDLNDIVILDEGWKGEARVFNPEGFVWIDQPVHVKGGDYEYDGQLLCSFPKEVGGAVRYIVRDANRRLFIHNAKQCGMEEV